jgi:hypothetical protein
VRDENTNEGFSIILARGKEENGGDYYAVIKGGTWDYMGNYCGFYANEHIKNTTLYGKLDSKYKVIVMYDPPINIERLDIVSCYWGGNRNVDTIDEIINGGVK